MTKKEPELLSREIFLTFFAITLFLLFDILLFLSDFSFTLKMVTHFGSLLLALLFLIVFFYKIDSRFFTLFILFSATLGPWGGVVLFVSIILYISMAKIIQPLVDLLSTLLPFIREEKDEIAYERIIYHLDNFNPDKIPIPFKDIMLFGSYKQKRMAIEKMLRYYRPEFAEPLKLGLSDHSSAIKVQAATALSSIDHKFFDEQIEFKKQLEEDPENLAVLKKYALHSLLYVELKILDEDRKLKVANTGIKTFEKVLDLDAKDNEAKFYLAKLYTEKKDYKKAKELLLELKEVIFTEETLFLLLDVFYKLEEYSEVKKLAKLIQDKIDPAALSAELKEVISFWLKEGKA